MLRPIYKKSLTILVLFGTAFSAYAITTLTPEEELEAVTKPEKIEWCDNKKNQSKCYDGISYANLDLLNYPKEKYPKTKLEYYQILKDLNLL